MSYTQNSKRKKPQPRSWGFIFAEGRRTETFSKIAPDRVYITYSY